MAWILQQNILRPQVLRTFCFGRKNLHLIFKITVYKRGKILYNKYLQENNGKVFIMRVITGSARGRKLKAPEGMDVRPTGDKVKEAVFSAVQFDIAGAVTLDLFSGSGQLGIEALSRGAKSCVFVDSSRVSLDYTRENIAAAGFKNSATVVSADCADYLRMCRQTFDIAFLDPPYKTGLIEKVMPLLCPHMSERGIAVCEHEKGLTLPDRFGGLVKYKTYTYGKTWVTIYKTENGEETE